MGTVKRGVQIVLAVTILATSIVAISAQNSSTSIENPIADPRSDPKYADLNDNGYYESLMSQFAGTTEHEQSFKAAMSEYYTQEEKAENARYDQGERRDQFAIITALLIAGLFFVSLPWGRAGRSIARTGRKTTDAAIKSFVGEPGTSIIGTEKLARYSVADELRKWQQLRADGVVTEREFDEARAKLLNR